MILYCTYCHEKTVFASIWQWVWQHMTEADMVWHAFTLIGRVRNEIMEYVNICRTWEWYDSMARYVTGCFTAAPLIRHGTVGVAEPTIVPTVVRALNFNWFFPTNVGVANEQLHCHTNIHIHMCMCYIYTNGTDIYMCTWECLCVSVSVCTCLRGK